VSDPVLATLPETAVYLTADVGLWDDALMV
jgi:hypothetical protein